MDFKEWIKDRQNLLFVVILVFSIILRIWVYIKTVGQPVWWDEADYLLSAQRLFGLNDFFTLNPRRPFLIPAIWGFMMKIGLSEAWLRITELIVSIFGVVLAYFAGKEMYNKRVGLIAAFGVAVFWQYLFFTGRLLVGLPMTVFWLGAIYFFWKAHIKKAGHYNYYWFGLFLGLTVFTRGAGILLAAVLGLYLLFTEKLNFLKCKHLWYAFVIFLVVIAPFFVYMQFQLEENVFVKYTGVTEDRFSRGMGLSGIGTYVNFFPSYLFWPFLVVFLLGLGLLLIDLALSLDLIFKGESKKFNNDLLLVIWLIIPFLFFSIFVDHMEPRYIMVIFPAIFFIMGKGLLKIGDFVEKYKKGFGTVVIVLILLGGGYFQLVQADAVIGVKSDSYAQVQESGYWLNENTPEDAVIYSGSTPHHGYYAVRTVYGFPETEEMFWDTVDEVDPDYMVISIYEYHREWVYAFPELNPEMVQVVQTYTLEGQPSLIIYEFV